MFHRILIANRGEVARRVARTCRRLGIEPVGVYSEADAGAAYLHDMAQNYCLGAAAPAQSYLHIERIIAAAREGRCQAIHPGYGFLSENADFAAAVEAAGLTFIGPSPEVIRLLGDKGRAKSTMQAAGVPVVPGSPEATQDLDRLLALAREVGLPLLLKPSAGGGGKGMQVVRELAQLPLACEQAIRLAQSNFGDGRLIIERYIDRPRHIEVQIMGDGLGQAVHFFERECSLQRRHQKVVEEAPAVCLAPEVRQRLLDAAVQGARAIGYRNAGTFEFIVDPKSQFYFLEVNTRLQVEHPVTEEITGVDLVEWQIRLAAGQGLPARQEDIRATGVAIEVRVYAEDPAQGFLPAPGRAELVRWPDDARVESAFDQSGDVPPFYDPMVAKLIVHAPDRAQALEKMGRALRQTQTVGLTTNIGFLLNIVQDPLVAQGQFHTRYLDDHAQRLVPQADPQLAAAVAAMLLHTEQHRAHIHGDLWMHLSGQRQQLDPAGGRGVYPVWIDAQLLHVELLAKEPLGRERFSVGGQEFEASEVNFANGLLSAQVNGKLVLAMRLRDHIELTLAGVRALAQPYAARNPQELGATGEATAPMHGVVVAIDVALGQSVKCGDRLVVVEAMKMENPVVAAMDGVVSEIYCAIGQQVVNQQMLVVIKEQGP
jgi:propionyl-CoA carboxylase alpha chain/3-methylcrotonyl-CoA carboxylase alpha subunit